MSAIKIRIRKRLRFYSPDAAMVGQVVELFSVPPRTTLTLTEIQESGALAVLRDGRRIFVDRETIRDYGYTPRVER